MNTPAREAADGASALYVGTVMHQRLRPARHRLRYRVFSLLLDLDELPALAARLRWFSLNRFNLFSVHERDHTDGTGSLREDVDRRLRAAGLPSGGPIRLLTMPRILGYAFNPLSVYFCHAPGGALRAILYEVNNTFGERHRYLIEVDAAHREGEPIVQHCAKQLHVSPFLALDMQYRFDVLPPAAAREPMRIGIVAQDRDGALLNAALNARREPLTDRALLRVFASHPLLTLKVVAAIHWEALRLVLKRVRVHTKPRPPHDSVTVIKHP